MTCPICDKKPMNCDCTPEERRMHAEIEDLVERMPRWIPTTEELPFTLEQVLIYCPLLEPNEVTVAQRQLDGDWACADGQLLGSIEPTHWMPLPEAPKC